MVSLHGRSGRDEKYLKRCAVVSRKRRKRSYKSTQRVRVKCSKFAKRKQKAVRNPKSAIAKGTGLSNCVFLQKAIPRCDRDARHKGLPLRGYVSCDRYGAGKLGLDVACPSPYISKAIGSVKWPSDSSNCSATLALTSSSRELEMEFGERARSVVRGRAAAIGARSQSNPIYRDRR